MNNHFRNRQYESLRHIVAIIQQLDTAIQQHIAIDQEEHVGNESIDTAIFTDSTQRLVERLLNAKDRMLPHRDIRIHVMFNPEANDNALRKAICIARKELKAANPSFDIVSVKKRGYQLVRRDALPIAHEKTFRNVTKPSKTSGKTSDEKW